jgi:hypothetical protein
VAAMVKAKREDMIVPLWRSRPAVSSVGRDSKAMGRRLGGRGPE